MCVWLQPAVASKHALRNAQKNMIHINTYNGQLYHDLIGQKHNCQVIIRSGALCAAVPRWQM